MGETLSSLGRQSSGSALLGHSVQQGGTSCTLELEVARGDIKMGAGVAMGADMNCCL